MGRLSAVLIAAVAVLSFNLLSFVSGQCTPTPCGVNTQCDVSRSGAAVCKCLPGWDHAPNGNTIDGCPVRISGGVKSSAPITPRRPSVSTLGNRLGSNRFAVSRPRDNFNGDPCVPDPCGRNADCRSSGNRAVCSCPPNHSGDPYTECVLDPCENFRCGINAECESRGNQAICKCPPGYEGDPFVSCSDDPCNADPCHPNADCRSEGTRAICTCRQNYEGDGISQCTLNACLTNPCGINAECANNRGTARCSCPRGYEGDPYTRCNLNPCLENPCGPNANCEAQGSSARCSCLPGYVGNPASQQGCQLEPCSQDPCGLNAECESRGRSALCRCPRGFTGDPYTRCNADPCGDEPCGINAICENQGSSYTCKCPPNFVGSPYESCRFDPCADNPCGRNTECTVSGEQAICRCLRGFTGSPNSRSGCQADPCSVADICGVNAVCENNGGRPTCTCAPGTVGDPYRECVRGECISNDECPDNQACQDYRCTDPCSTSCGSGADCETRNHVAICRCPRGFTGDPFQSCRRFTADEICADACGANTDCEVGHDERPICKCKPNYIGNPLTGCRYECTSSRECAQTQKCENYRCVAVCDQDACGENANCSPRNNQAQCTCPEDFLGDAYSRCYTECVRHDDCSDQQACVKFRCKDPCYEPQQVCGTGANCEVKSHKAICSCPRGFTGDPFVSCRQFTKEDLCQPSPCGANARCQPGFDRSGNDRPVCTCPSGYVGDPLISCNRGECESDNDCPSNRGCYNFRCEDPCGRGACGVGADCRVVNHASICTCPSGTVGDALVACREQRRNTQTRVIGRSGSTIRRFKRFADEVLSYFY